MEKILRRLQYYQNLSLGYEGLFFTIGISCAMVGCVSVVVVVKGNNHEESLVIVFSEGEPDVNWESIVNYLKEEGVEV